VAVLQEVIVNRPVAFPRALLAAALVVLSPALSAQTAKAPPRLSPPPSQTSQIPGGQDTGTPGGSDSQQLGMPVMSNSTGQGTALRGGSAAARAAARPKPAVSSADCTRPLEAAGGDKAASAPLPKATLTGNAKPAPTKAPVARGATRVDC
jgi:hypothetical protein